MNKPGGFPPGLFLPSEVINMLLTEWNISEAKEVWREEAPEEEM
jgi:hypothetical protein